VIVEDRYRVVSLVFLGMLILPYLVTLVTVVDQLWRSLARHLVEMRSRNKRSSSEYPDNS
jgi:hypothetical protein